MLSFHIQHLVSTELLMELFANHHPHPLMMIMLIQGRDDAVFLSSWTMQLIRHFFFFLKSLTTVESHFGRCELNPNLEMSFGDIFEEAIKAMARTSELAHKLFGLSFLLFATDDLVMRLEYR